MKELGLVLAQPAHHHSDLGFPSMHSAVLKPLTFIHLFTPKTFAWGLACARNQACSDSESEVIQFPVPRSTKHSERRYIYQCSASALGPNAGAVREIFLKEVSKILTQPFIWCKQFKRAFVHLRQPKRCL